MDKDGIVETEKNVERTDSAGRSLKELKEQLAQLSKQLEKCQIKFIQLNQEEEVRKKQEILLQKQAHDLNEIVTVEQRKLHEIRRQAEAHVEEFIHKINCALERNKQTFETNGDTAEKIRRKRRIDNERRKKYFQLKGELGALLLYKEYQECVIDELRKIDTHSPTEAI